MKNLFVLVFISILFLGCKKDKLKDEKEIFIGKWKWVYSEKTIRWNCDNPPQVSILTPVTENIEYSMEFVKKGFVTFYKGGEEVDKYRIVFNSDIELSNYPYLSGYYEFQILLNNKEDKFFTGYVSNDTLIETGNWFPYVGSGQSCLSFRSYFVRE